MKLTKINKLPENPYGALTLSPTYLGKHEDGWEITGAIHEDYYAWINRFVAYKHTGDWKEEIVCGDFEDTIYASSKEAYEDFVKNYPPEAWDYGDI